MENKEIEILNVERLTQILIAGSRWLSKHADILNDLNVYPVPDGDTGTNMSMTLQSVENELIKLSKKEKMSELCEIISEAVLLGARGNSGTILSQIIQGFLSVIENYEEVDVEIVKKAITAAKDKAYKAVNEPVEGTMLTVIRKVSEEANLYSGKDLVELLAKIKNAANEAVLNTPNQLEKLKEAGVVDAGGKGIFFILEGFEKAITDPEMENDLKRIVKSQSNRQQKMEYIAKEDIKFSYCTEFIIESADFDLEEYKKEISIHGDSMVAAQTSKKTKTHIHTNNPGLVLEIAVSHGPLNNIKIENMKIQHNHILVSDKEIKGEIESKTNFLYEPKNITTFAIYAIADNEEMAKLFIEEGACASLVGGQTNNPSVQDIEKGLEKIQCDNIYILPNNKNIIASAKIAADRDKRNVLVLDTKTMLEGHYIIRNKKYRLINTLKQRAFNYSIEITKAIRNSKYNDISITEGDYIAIVNGNIELSNKNLNYLLKDILENYINQNTLNVVVARGVDATNKFDEEFKKIDSKILNIYDTKQENYPYYIYIEEKDPNLAKVAIVTDSSSDLNEEIINGLPITIIPLRIQMNDKTYKDGETISKKEFWSKILHENIIPKTAQPSPSDLKNTYDELFKRGYEKIISIHISSKMSGTCQAAKIAREMTKNEENIEIIDSKAITFALGHQVLEAAKMAKDKKSVEEIVENVKSLVDRMKVYFTVDDLIYLQRGGRIGRASLAIGGFLRVKPVVTIIDGELSVATKAIGESGAFSFMKKMIKEESKNSSILYVGWGGTTKELQKADLLRKEAEEYRKIEFKGRFEIGPTIGSHSGPVYGLGIISKIR